MKNIRTHIPKAGARAAAFQDRTKLSLRVHLRLADCRNLLMRESRRSIERSGLTLAQFDVLAELERNTRGGFTFGELSRLLLVTSGNLTGIVDRLESDGLAARKGSKDDRRVVRIVLTRKGRQLIQEITREHGRDIRAVLEPISRDRQSTLEQLLHNLSDQLRIQAAETRAPAGTAGGRLVPDRNRPRGGGPAPT